MAKNGFKVPQEQEFMGIADWVFDGPYRRVPPYFYVYSTFVFLLTGADILHMGKTAVARRSPAASLLHGIPRPSA